MLQLARMEEALVQNMRVMTENKAKLEDLKQVRLRPDMFSSQYCRFTTETYYR